MKVDYSPRQSGKTTKMIKWVSEKPQRKLLTFSLEEQSRLRSMYPELSGQIYFWKEWLDKKRQLGVIARDAEIGIDNADYILDQVMGTYVRNISLNKEQLDLREQ